MSKPIYTETGPASAIADTNERQRIRRAALNAAYEALSPIEQAAIERQITRLMDIKGIGRDTALEVLAAVGRLA